MHCGSDHKRMFSGQHIRELEKENAELKQTSEIFRKYLVFSNSVTGIAGFLLAPAVMYMIKVSKCYPELFWRIFITVFVLIGIYGFFFFCVTY